jgi:hypothetical protein
MESGGCPAVVPRQRDDYTPDNDPVSSEGVKVGTGSLR